METLKIVKPGDVIRVIVLGSGPLAIHLIKGLLRYPTVADIVGIMPASNIKQHAYIKDEPCEKELFQLASDNQIMVSNASSVNSSAFLNELNELKPHVVLVGGWSEILKPPVVGYKDLHIMNCHGSMLPKYRGAQPYMAPVFYGDRHTACTFHLIDEGIDTGDILLQVPIDVGERETSHGLFNRIAIKFGETVGPLFDDLVKGKIVPRKQEGIASYVPQPQAEWGWIPWEMRPDKIDQRIRAMYGVLPLVTSLNGTVMGFESGAVVEADDLGQAKGTRSRLTFPIRPGTIIANRSDRIVVATRDPHFTVELNKPCIVPPGQRNSVDELLIGDQFFSIECHDILKTA